MRKRTYTRGWIELSDGTYLEIADPYAVNQSERGGIVAEIVTAEDFRYGVMVGFVAINQPDWILRQICENPRKWQSTIGGFLADRGFVTSERLITTDEDRLYFQAHKPMSQAQAFDATERLLK